MTESDRRTVRHVLVRARDASILTLLALLTAWTPGTRPNRLP